MQPRTTPNPNSSSAQLTRPMQCQELGLVHLSSSSSSFPCLPRPRARHLPSPSSPMASAAGGPHSVFVYGTLMAEEVVRVLLGRAPLSAPTLLPDLRRLSIRGRVYPAILPVQGTRVHGKVFRALTDRELEVLDAFEDEEYVRKTVEVSLTDTSEQLLAYAYIWGDENDPDLYGEWDFEEWRKVHLKDYLQMTQEFMDELERDESKP